MKIESRYVTIIFLIKSKEDNSLKGFDIEGLFLVLDSLLKKSRIKQDNNQNE
jgi:hypothetical protein